MNRKHEGHRDGDWQVWDCGGGEWGHKHGSIEERRMNTHFLQKVHIFLPGGFFEKVVRQELEQKS